MADPAAQVAGLQTTYLIAAGIMVVAVIIGAWGLSKERSGLSLQEAPGG
jgi:hypothetical protein